jgi:multiple sugar transport system permease protein
MKKILCRINLHIIGIILSAIFLFPIVLLFVSSVKPSTEIFDYRLIPNTIYLKNYEEVLGTLKIGRNMLNSFIIASAVTILALLVHSMAGFAFAKLRFPGKKGLFYWMLSTMMVPFSVILIPLFYIVKQLNLIDTYWAVIIPMVPHAYGTFLFRQFFRGVPYDLYESAMIDGASIFRIFYQIFLPLSRAIAITMGVSFFITNWNNYLWPLVATQKSELWVIQIAIASFQGNYRVDWSLVLAASTLAVIPTILLFLFFQRYLVEGIKMSGIKD